MRKSVLKQLLLEAFNVGGVYKNCYDRSSCIFVHTPKTAGTSVAFALYGQDPWHYTADELRLINKKKFDGMFSFGVVRNPVDRITSTFNYSRSEENFCNPKSGVNFMKKYPTIDDFVLSGLTEELVSKHYFFWPYSRYLEPSADVSVNEVIKFEDIEAGFNNVCKKLGLVAELPRKNVSVSRQSCNMSRESEEKILKIYKEDFVRYYT